MLVKMSNTPDNQRLIDKFKPIEIIQLQIWLKVNKYQLNLLTEAYVSAEEKYSQYPTLGQSQLNRKYQLLFENY